MVKTKEATATKTKAVPEVKQEPVEEAKIVTVSPSPKEISKAKIKKIQEEETRLVEGRFRNFETPGASARIQIKKYKDIPMFDMTMSDNETYKIPLYVARHLNGIDKCAEAINGEIHSCSHLIHAWRHGKFEAPPTPADPHTAGIPVPLLTSPKYRRRYGFDSMEFSSVK